jgi:hypothetical protein
VALAAAGCGSSKVAEHSQVAVRSPAEYHLVYEKLVGEKGVWIADTDGGNPRLLVADSHSPVISPDGRSVAYVGGCDADDRCKGTYIVSTSAGKTAARLVGHTVHVVARLAADRRHSRADAERGVDQHRRHRR